jgi:trimeric autotransporter adhesin
VTAQYAGDGFYAPSASQPVTLTVTPEDSVVTPVVHYDGGDVTNGQQVPFGSQWTFEAAPSSVSNGTSGQATGTVTFTDGTASAEVAIGSAGIGAVNIPNLAIGSHSVSVSYSGDASFNASTGGPLAFTVVPGVPRITITTSISQLIQNGSAVPIPAGSNLTVGVLVGSGFGVAPTGNINVTLGATTQIAELAPIVLEGRVLATAQTTFANLQPGTFTLSANYPGDANWNTNSATFLNPVTVANVLVVPTTITLTATPASVTSQGNVTLTATVQGGAGALSAPFGSVFFYADGVSLAATITQSSGATSSTATMVVPGVRFPNGAHQITAAFPGFNGTFGPSISAPVTVTANLSTFTLSLASGTIVIPSGQSGSATLLLNGENGFNGPLPLSCAPSSSSIGCSVTPSSPMVSGATTAMVAVNAFIEQGGLAGAPPVNGSRRVPPGVLIVSAVLILLALYNSIYRTPRRNSTRLRWALGSFALALVLLTNGCGGGSSNLPPPPPPQKVPAPAGTYGVVVTASAGGIIHNVKLTVVVQ